MEEAAATDSYKVLMINTSDDNSGILVEKKRRSFWYMLMILALTSSLGFGFGGFMSTLASYFYDDLHFSKGVTTMIVNLSVAFNFCWGPPGGALSDSVLGPFRTILTGLGLYVFGFGVFLISTLSAHLPLDFAITPNHIAIVLSFIGLISLSIGNGLINPVVASFVGDQFQTKAEIELRSKFYSWFYWSINLGSIASGVVAPIILSAVGATVLFIMLGSGLIIGGTIFIIGRPFYVIPKHHNDRNQRQKKNPFKVFFGIIRQGFKSNNNRPYDYNDETSLSFATSSTNSPSSISYTPDVKPHWLDKAKPMYGSHAVEEVKTVLKILAIFTPMPFFWFLYYQIFSLWVFQAEGAQRHVFGFDIPAAEVISLNPIIDSFLIPFLSYIVYPWIKPRAITKMRAGIFCSILAMLCAGSFELYRKHSSESPSVFWMIPQFFFISCSEILVSVTALEFSYSQAPKRMKGMLTASWLITVAVGNILVGIAGLVTENLSTDFVVYEYFVFGGGMVVVFFIFIWISWNYVEQEPPASDESAEESETLLSSVQ